MFQAPLDKCTAWEKRGCYQRCSPETFQPPSCVTSASLFLPPAGVPWAGHPLWLPTSTEFRHCLPPQPFSNDQWDPQHLDTLAALLVPPGPLVPLSHAEPGNQGFSKHSWGGASWGSVLECGGLPPWCVGVEWGVWVSPRTWITVEFEGLLQLPSLSLLPGLIWEHCLIQSWRLSESSRSPG